MGIADPAGLLQQSNHICAAKSGWNHAQLPALKVKNNLSQAGSVAIGGQD